jgi:hypothetical protein
MQLADVKRQASGRLSCGTLVLIILAFAFSADILFPAPDDYPFSATTRPVIKNSLNLEKPPRASHDQLPANALAVGNRAYSPGFKGSFVSHDRKQNLRLWPLVAQGLIRSPPRSSALS